jgi:hypothetical protein
MVLTWSVDAPMIKMQTPLPCQKDNSKAKQRHRLGKHFTPGYHAPLENMLQGFHPPVRDWKSPSGSYACTTLRANALLSGLRRAQ